MVHLVLALFDQACLGNQLPLKLLTKSHHLMPDKKSFTVKFKIGEVTKMKGKFP